MWCRVAGYAVAQTTQIAAPQPHAQRAPEGVVGLDDTRLDQHLTHRDVDARDQELDFLELARDIADEELVRARIGDHASARRQDAHGLAGAARRHPRTAALARQAACHIVGFRVIQLERLRAQRLELGELLARLDQSREMASKPVDLSEVVESAVISARAAGPQHSVIFTKPDSEIFVLGDEPRIHQVIANLLANARAHTPVGTEIRVSISHDSDGVRISVSDNGPGLSQSDQEKIFERFYRADTSRVRVDGEGSGLGLSIVDAVMKAHKGSVTVVSELGKGATFTLFFPVDAQ